MILATALRLDWGFGNPNRTGTFIALLMLAVWVIAYVWKHGFWLSLLATTALSWYLVETFSRGGLAAFIAGLVILLIWTPRPWPLQRCVGSMISLCILGVFILYWKEDARLSKGLFADDLSISHRLIIWEHVPAMMWSAPWGWGLGRAGDAYTQWFEPLDLPINYITLVSSHFTWAVELGWIGSVVYLFAWLMVFYLVWPQPGSVLKSLPLAAWVTLFVGACFSCIAETPFMWILPLPFLVYSVWFRFGKRLWPRLCDIVYIACAALCIVACFIILGALSSGGISFYRSLQIGSGPKQAVLIVDRKVLGQYYGQTLRSFLSSAGNTRYRIMELDNLEPLQSEPVDVLILTGNIPDSLLSGSQNAILESKIVKIVNPAFSPSIFDTQNNKNITAYLGEYAHTPSYSSWLGQTKIKAVKVEGASDFIPDWPTSLSLDK